MAYLVIRLTSSIFLVASALLAFVSSLSSVHLLLSLLLWTTASTTLIVATTEVGRCTLFFLCACFRSLVSVLGFAGVVCGACSGRLWEFGYCCFLSLFRAYFLPSPTG